MQHLLFLWIIIASSLDGYSQQFLRGTVIDKTSRQSLERTTITMLPVGTTSVAAEPGRFQFERINESSVVILTSPVEFDGESISLGDLISSAGIKYKNTMGLNGSFSYRYVSDPSANEDYKGIAEGHFIADAVIGYAKPKYEIGLVINNLFSSKWKDRQFASEARINNELVPLDEICFAAKLSFTLKF